MCSPVLAPGTRFPAAHEARAARDRAEFSTRSRTVRTAALAAVNSRAVVQAPYTSGRENHSTATTRWLGCRIQRYGPRSTSGMPGTTMNAGVPTRPQRAHAPPAPLVHEHLGAQGRPADGRDEVAVQGCHFQWDAEEQADVRGGHEGEVPLPVLHSAACHRPPRVPTGHPQFEQPLAGHCRQKDL